MRTSDPKPHWNNRFAGVLSIPNFGIGALDSRKQRRFEISYTTRVLVPPLRQDDQL